MNSGADIGNSPDSRLVISGCGIISSIGIGIDAFTAGFWERRSGRRNLEGVPDAAPIEQACVTAEFDAASSLGNKGIRNMDRTTALVVATAGMALRDRGVDLESDTDRIGVVLGTSTGSVKSAWDFTQQTLTRTRPYLVDPGVFPSTILNCAASQCAIWHKLKGVNATIAGGTLSGLLGLRYATVCLLQRYADMLLVGAVEEFSDPVAWAFFHTRSVAALREQPPGEGCAFFVLERLDADGQRYRAEVLATEVGVFPATAEHPGAQSNGLADCIRRALKRAGAAPADVVAVSKRGSADGPLRDAEQHALDAALDGHTPLHQIVIADLIGECFSASSSFQLAALLAVTDRVGDEAPQHGLVVSMSRGGAVGCSVIRKANRRPC